jgi:hypothetical protein
MGTKNSWRFISWEKVHITLYITQNAAVGMFGKADRNGLQNIATINKMRSTAVGKSAGIKGPS